MKTIRKVFLLRAGISLTFILALTVLLDSCYSSQENQIATKLSVTPIPQVETPVNTGSLLVKCMDCSRRGNVWILLENGDLLFANNVDNTWKRATAGNFEQIDFSDDGEIGWAVTADGVLMRSEDKGESWAKVSKLDYEGEAFAGPFEALSFVDKSHGWVLDPFNIWRSEDGGKSWEGYKIASFSDKIRVPVHKMYFINPLKGWAGGEEGNIYITKDGGRRWVRKSLDFRAVDIINIFFVDEHIGWVDGSIKGLFKTQNGGLTWKYQPFHQDEDQWFVSSIFFISRDIGYVIGMGFNNSIMNNTGGFIFKTYDGGQNWKRIKIASGEQYYQKMCFIDERRGWLIGRESVYFTDDEGLSWKKVISLVKN
jgi:photosystem II stability/assembly factor-like uncharacterized protein